MDYAAELEKAEEFIGRGHTTEAIQILGRALEQLYMDLYRQLRGRLPRSEAEKVIKIEAEIGGNKQIGKFTLGDIIQLYRKANLIPMLANQLGLSLPFFKTYDPYFLLGLRNQATHHGVQIAEHKAWLCFWQIYQVLKETGQKVPESMPSRRREASDRDTTLDRPQFSSADWARYAEKLGGSLALEGKAFRVPVDIVPNKVEEFSRRQAMEQPSSSTRPWHEIALSSKEDLVVLLGEPGEGKTVSFTTLAQSMLDDFQSDQEAPLPVKVRLAFYKEDGTTLEDLIADQLRLGKLEMDASAVTDVLSERRFYVLLDGLNEVSNHLPLVGELGALMSKAPESKYFLSCRTADYGPIQEQLPAHRAWQLQRFSPEEIRDFLERVIDDEPGRTQRLDAWLSDKRLVEVLGTPFFVSLFADLAPSARLSPQNRAELCQCFVDEYQARELKTRPELQDFGFPWSLLEEAAFRMQNLQETYLQRRQFEELCRQVWVAQFYEQEATVTLQETLRMLYGSPLLTHGSGRVAFAHQLFRDFFAAHALAKKDDLDDSATFARLVGDTGWDYTIVLLAGLLDDASKVLFNIIYEGANYDLAVRCLRELKRLDLRVLHDTVEWMRQGHQFSTLFLLDPLIASLPESTREWRAAEAEAIVKTGLANERLSDRGPAVLWISPLAFDGWPVSDEMILQAAQDGIQSSNGVERGNSVFLLAKRGQWDRVLDVIDDPDPYVRKMLALSIARFAETGGSDGLQAAVLRLSQDPEAEVRCAAMEAACTVASEGEMAALENGLTDPDANVRLATLRELLQAEGDWVPDAQAKAMLLLDDLMEEFISNWDLPGVEEDPTEMILDALAWIKTPKSSDFLYLALITGLARDAFVAETLADRGDLRCLRALVEEMLDSPRTYFEDLAWLEGMEKKIVALLDHPFELPWLEALLVKEEVRHELDFGAPQRYLYRRDVQWDPHSALEAIVEVCSSNRGALMLFLWPMLYAWVQRHSFLENTALLEGAVLRLIEIDPTILVDDAFGYSALDFAGYAMDTPQIDFAERLLTASASLLEALPSDLKDKFWPAGKANDAIA